MEIKNKKSEIVTLPVAVVVLNLIQYESILPGLEVLKKNNIYYDIFVPKLSNDKSGFKEMFDKTFNFLKSKNVNPIRSTNQKTKYIILFTPYNLNKLISIQADYNVRYQYGFATKPEWGLKYETNTPYDYILCYSEYDQSFYRAYAETEIIGFLRYANYKISNNVKRGKKKKILYLPTYGELSSIDEIIPILKTLRDKYRISIKLHHGTSFLKNENERVKSITNIFDNVYTSNDSLEKLIDETDLVLSDRSGAIFDSIYLEKPVVAFSRFKNYFHGKESLLDTLIRDHRIISTSKTSELEKIIKIGFTDDYRKKQKLLKENLFPITGKKSLTIFMNFVKNLLSDNVDQNYQATHREIFNYEKNIVKQLQISNKKYESAINIINEHKNIILKYENANLDINKKYKNSINIINKQKNIILKNEKAIRDINKKYKYVSEYLNKILNSKLWKIFSRYYSIKNIINIKNTYEKLKQLTSKARSFGLTCTLNKISGYIFKKNSYNPYNYIKLLKNIDVKIIEKDYSKTNITLDYSTVTPVFNEQEKIIDFLVSLENQTIHPKESIIVDTGSTDQTKKIIKKYIETNTKIKIILIESKTRIGISEGRNLGVKKITSENIIFMDAGNKFDAKFCQNLIGVFQENDKVDLVAPIALPVKRNPWTYEFLVNWDNMNWIKNYLPAARGLLVKKDIFNKVGGFAEYLKWSGEDTFFDISYRRKSKLWIINKSAKCYWFGPDTFEKVGSVHKRYGEGDGINGVGDFLFYPRYKHWQSYCAFPNKNFYKNKFSGYLIGLKKRPEIELSLRKIQKYNIILSDNQFTDFDGNSKSTQKAIDLINKNEKVFFININTTFTKRKKLEPLYIDIDYSLLELYHIDKFNVKYFLKTHKDIDITLHIFTKNKIYINKFLKNITKKTIYYK